MALNTGPILIPTGPVVPPIGNPDEDCQLMPPPAGIVSTVEVREDDHVSTATAIRSKELDEEIKTVVGAAIFRPSLSETEVAAPRSAANNSHDYGSDDSLSTEKKTCQKSGGRN